MPSKMIITGRHSNSSSNRLVFALAAAALIAVSTTIPSASGQEERCGIRCIFKGETGEILEATYPIPESDGLQLKVYSGSCTSFDFTGGSRTVYLNTSAYEVWHETTEVSTDECTTSYDILARNGSVLEEGGFASFSLRIPSLVTGVRVVVDPADTVPTGIELSKCESNSTRFVLSAADKRPDDVRRALEAAGTAEDAVCRSLRGLVRGWDKRFGEWAETIRAAEREPEPPQPEPPSPEEAADLCNLRESAVLNVIRYAVNDVLGVKRLEGLMDIVTNGTGHAWANMSDDVITGIIGGYLLFITSDVLYGFPDGDFYNISKWNELSTGVPAPEDNYTFVTRAGMPAFRAELRWLAESMISARDWTYLGDNNEYGGMVLGFADAEATVRLRTLVNATRLRALTPPQLLAPGCLLGALNEFKISALVLNASAVTGQGFFFEYGDFEPEFNESINSFIAALTAAYGPHKVGTTNGYYVPGHLAALNTAIAMALGNDWPCPDLPAYVAPPVVNFTALWATLAATLVLWAAVLVAAELSRRSSNSNNSKFGVSYYYNDSQQQQQQQQPPTEANRLVNPTGTPGTSPFYSSPRSAVTPDNDVDDESVSLTVMAAMRPSLLMTPALPAWLRYIVPLLLFVNVSMFIVSNTSISASVFPTVVFGDFPVEVGSLFDFGLANTIRDMWFAGVYPLAILIAFFSGAWPYVKLVLMFAAWSLPPLVLPVRPRESILRVVDALGKWSLIDSYVMTLMLVAFRYHIVIPAPAGAAAPPSYIDVIVDARLGFVLFVLATMLSLVLGHVILALHRSTEARYARTTTTTTTTTSSGGAAVTYTDRDMDAEEQARRRVALRTVAFPGLSKPLDVLLQVLVAVFLVATIALVCYGISAQSLVFDVRGLVGWLFELMGVDPRREYSLLEMGAHVLSSAANPSSFTAILIVVIFFATAVVFPLLHLLVLIVLWLAPLSLAAQRRVYVLVEVLNAWSALDVYVIACIAALLQLRQFALWIVGDSCDFINPLIKKYLAPVVPGDPVCFDLVAKLDNGSWILLGACVLYIISSYIVMGKCHSALELRRGDKSIN